MANGNVPQGQQHEPTEQEVLDDFRDSVEDAITLVESLAQHCTDIDEMVGMLTLATKNNAQLRLLLRQATPKRLRH